MYRNTLAKVMITLTFSLCKGDGVSFRVAPCLTFPIERLNI